MRMNPRVVGLLAAAIVAVPGSLSAATFVVNSTGNSSDSNVGNGVCRTSSSGTTCTLRAAIQEANATTASDIIEFAIDSGPQRITLTSSLPTITRPVVIDGWTQPGFSGQPLIEVRGSSGYGDGFKISGGNSTVRGLIINNFGGDGIILTGSTGNNVIEGNYIGTNADGSEPIPNEETGIRIQCPNNRIGGREPQQRNVVSGNTDARAPFDSYCEPSGHGEAKYYVGDGTAVTDGSGNATIHVALPGVLPRGYALTAVAIDPDHNTSELARCVFIQ